MANPIQTVSATEAKNHLASVMEMARTQPVLIEKNGKPAVVMLSVDAYERRYRQTDGDQAAPEPSAPRLMTGEMLVTAMQTSPGPETELEPARLRLPVTPAFF